MLRMHLVSTNIGGGAAQGCRSLAGYAILSVDGNIRAAAFEGGGSTEIVISNKLLFFLWILYLGSVRYD